MRVHRVIVAHGASARCQEHFGRSGSLIVAPEIVGESHRKGDKPFGIGRLSDSKPFVHVLDDRSLLLLMQYLDTAWDFIGYLKKREAFILSGRLRVAEGEEALLGRYVADLNAADEHDFVFADGATEIHLTTKSWLRFLNSPELASKVAADEVSYLWDRIIEAFAMHFRAGTSDYLSAVSGHGADLELLLRFFAREGRTRRRMLAGCLMEMATSTPPHHRRFREVPPSSPGDPHWLLLLFPAPEHLPWPVAYDEYRRVRRQHLADSLSVVKLRNPDAVDIVGFTTETGCLTLTSSSEDAAYLDARVWTPAHEADAREAQTKTQILLNPKKIATRMKEYPVSSS